MNFSRPDVKSLLIRGIAWAGRRTELASFEMRAMLPDCPPPLFALAHSMGAAILMRAAARQMPRPNFRGRQLRKLANYNPRFFV